MKPLEREYHYYMAHEDELVDQYEGQYIVIQGIRVLGAYADQFEAVEKMLAQGLTPGTFMVHKCERNPEPIIVNSRVKFIGVCG